MAQRFPDLAGSTHSFPSAFLGALQQRGSPFIPLREHLHEHDNYLQEQILNRDQWDAACLSEKLLGSEGILKWAAQISMRFVSRRWTLCVCAHACVCVPMCESVQMWPPSCTWHYWGCRKPVLFLPSFCFHRWQDSEMWDLFYTLIHSPVMQNYSYLSRLISLTSTKK